MNAAPPNPAPLAVAEAQRRLLALAGPTPVEHAALHAAAGRWAAAPVQAARTQPASDLAMMDGYALRFADLGAPLRIVGESAAGAPFTGQVRIGQAVRIFTGAPVPAGADTVLMQEEALRERDRLKLSGEGPAAIGANIRPRGLDFVAGAPLIAAAAAVAFLAPNTNQMFLSGDPAYEAGYGGALGRARPRWLVWRPQPWRAAAAAGAFAAALLYASTISEFLYFQF